MTFHSVVLVTVFQDIKFSSQYRNFGSRSEAVSVSALIMNCNLLYRRRSRTLRRWRRREYYVEEVFCRVRFLLRLCSGRSSQSSRVMKGFVLYLSRLTLKSSLYRGNGFQACHWCN